MGCIIVLLPECCLQTLVCLKKYSQVCKHLAKTQVLCHQGVFEQEVYILCINRSLITFMQHIFKENSNKPICLRENSSNVIQMLQNQLSSPCEHNPNFYYRHFVTVSYIFVVALLSMCIWFPVLHIPMQLYFWFDGASLINEISVFYSYVSNVFAAFL